MVALTEPDRLHHLRDVLRVKRGDALSLFNAAAGELSATVEDVSRNAITFKIGQQSRGPHTPVARHLLFAPLKRQNTEWLVEKATELGVTHLQPALTAHTQVRSINADRLRTIAIDAAEQSGQLHVPDIAEPASLLAAAGQLGNMPLYAAIEPSRHAALPPLHTKLQDAKAPAAVLIGPEGGFSEDEAEQLAKLPNVIAVSLGDSVLRAETAAILACGLLHVYAGGNE